jgi:hypothetical protein
MSMATNKETDDAASGSSAYRSWTLTSLLLRHKRASLGSIAFLLLVIAVTFVTTLSSPSRQPLSDSATCSEWAAATPAQKISYSHVYINEYGAYPNTTRNADVIETSINKACIHASYLGEAEDVSVLASLRHAF